jgi:hypothetical protein
MCAAIEWGERRIDGAPAGRADLTLDHSATFGKYEIRTGTATFVTLRVVLIPRGGLRQDASAAGILLVATATTVDGIATGAAAAAGGTLVATASTLAGTPIHCRSLCD